jgi:uncharacterized repeat protein (TIGR01451 family)/fimbrial isopeptide formation D2 family protein
MIIKYLRIRAARLTKITLIYLCGLSSTQAQVALNLSAPVSVSTCDRVVFTNTFQNLGTTLDGLIITNQLPAGSVYVTDQTTITLPGGQVISGSSAEPTTNRGGTNLVWDFSSLTSDGGVSHLLITEVFYDPVGSVNEDSNEWVEVYNPGLTSVSLSGYTLGDALPGQYDALPAATVAPGQYVIIAASTSAFYLAHAGYTGLVIGVTDETLGSGLNNFGDGVFLKDGSAALVDAVSYGGSSAAFNPGATAVSEGQSLVRNPANLDNDNRNDWSAGTPSPGAGTVLTGISPSSLLTIVFKAELNCAAQTAYFRSGARYQQPAGGAVQSAAAAWNLSVQTPNLTLTKRPSVQTAGYGDTVVWTVRVENAGYGRADNVVLRDTRGPGIRFTGFSVNPTNSAPFASLTSVVWNASVVPALAALDPGESVSIIVTGLVAACTGLYNNIVAQNGCTGLQMVPDQTCFDSSAGGNEGGSVEFIYRYALVAGAISPGTAFTLPYCDGRDITIHLTNAPGADIGTAINLQLEPSLPAGYTISGPSYVTSLNRIVVGNLAPGQTTGITVRLRAGGACPLDTAQQLLTFRPTYTDACETPYTTPPLSAYSTLSQEPSAQISKLVPNTSGAASSLTVRVLYAYQNFANTTVSFADQLPVNSYWAITNVTGGGVTSSASVVRWNKTFDGSGVFTGTFDLVWTDPCEVGGTFANQVTASNYTDCAGCPRTVTGHGELYYFSISAANCATGNPGTGTCSFAVSMQLPTLSEVCETIAVTTRVSGLTDATTNDWNGVLFSNNLANGQAPLTSINDLRVLVDGADYTAYAYVTQTSPALRITFTNMNTTALPRPGLASTLEVSWRTTATNPGQYTLRSTLTLPGCSTRTASSGWTVGAGALDIDLAALVGQDACGLSYGRIDLTQLARPALSSLTNRYFPVYDVEVVLDLDVNRNGAASYSYQTNSTAFSNFFALAGGALSSAEPTSITSTQLVWNLGDLRTNSAGSIHFRLQGSCSAESGEKLRAFVRYNERCEDGLTPTRAAYSATNSIPVLYTATLVANLEPEISFLPGTSYVFRVELFNSGAGTAFNVSAEVAKPSNVAFVNAGVSPATSSATNLTWTFQFADSPGGLVDADLDGFEDDLPPNASVAVYVTNYITACDPTTIRLTAQSGCKSTLCQTTQDSTRFIPSSPSLNAATTFPNNHNLCATGTVALSIRNSGAGRAYEVQARHIIPFGVSYVSGSARASVDGSATNSIVNPTGIGTAAAPLMWDSTAIAAFADLAPNQEIKILYDVYLACDAVRSSQVYVARTTYRDNCGYGHTNDVSSGTVVPGSPVLSITKSSRNATLGQAAFTTATIPGNPGDVIVYRITVDHAVASQNDLLAMRITDLLPSSVTYLGASPTPSSISGQTLIWSNNTLMTLVGGAPYLRGADSFSLYVTSVVAYCTSSVQNVSWIEYGCSESCLSLGATSRVYHTFTPSLSSTFSAQDGMTLNEAGGRLRVTIQNSGGAAVSMVVTQAAPTGYLITGASVTGEYNSSSLILNLTGSPAGRTGIINFASTATSGATDLDDDLANGLSTLDLGYTNSITLTFDLVSDGSTMDCAADPRDYNFNDPDPAEPVSISARFASGSQDACEQPQTTSATVSTVPLRPDPDIDVQPNELLVTNNQVVTFTITVKNRGEQGNASNLHVRARLGSGWTDLVITGTSVVQSASGTVLTELQGNTNLLVSLPGVVLDPLDDQVVLTLQGRTRQGLGSLDIIAEVVGNLLNPAIPAGCTPTNTFAEAPMANTMTGSVISAVNGKYYGFDQDRTRVAGFSLKKTVRYFGEPAPGVTNLNARIGEDLVYRIESQIFGISLSNLVISESLPAHLVFGTPVDAGSSANVSNLWTYSPGTGAFTLPTPLSQDASFIVDIPVVVSNRAANQGDLPDPVIFTNAATPTFLTDGITNPPPSSLTQVRLLEPILQVSKASSHTAQTVQAGDLIIFTNTIRHSVNSLTNAYDLVFVDALPAGLTFAGVDLGADGLDNDADGIVDGADAADESGLVSGNTFTVTTNNSTALANLALNGSVQFIVPAYVLNQSLGSVLVNTGRVTWTSMPGNTTNRNERDGSGGINDYAGSGTTSITSRPVAGITKTLVDTSEAGTVDPRVTIGERLHYRIRVDFPAGSAYNVSIVDNVSTGLDFVGTNPDPGLTYPGTGYAFYVPTGGPQFPTTTLQGLVVTDPDTSPASSIDAVGSAKSITFNLGGITNAPDGIDTNDFFDLFVEYVVMNQTTNNGLGNPARSNVNVAIYTDSIQSLAATSTYTIIGEPDVTMSKRRSPATGAVDAGDVITFNLVASNRLTATANAYDFVITDNITNRFWDLNSITLIDQTPGWTFSAITNVNSIQVRFSSDPGIYLAPGQHVSNRFSVVVAQESGANMVYTNRADILIADTISGSPPTGTTGRTDNASSTVAFSNRNFTVVKSLVGTSENGPVDSTTTNVQVGEAVTYSLRVTVPEGTYTNLTITDLLPEGMSYAFGSASNDLTGFNGLLGTLTESPTGTGLADAGVDPVFTYSGASVVTGDNDTNNNAFTLYLTAVVRDVVGVNGLTGNTTFLTNLATVSFPANFRPAVTSGAVVVRVIEPSLSISKNLVQTEADAGDTITVDLVVTNSGLAAAFEVEISDPFDTFPADTNSVQAITVPAGFLFTVSNGAVHVQSDPNAAPPANSLEPGESIAIRFTADLADTIPPMSILTNRALISQADTISGTNRYAVQRSAAGATAQDTLVSGNAGLTKVLAGTSEIGAADSTNDLVQIGERVTYRLTVSLPEGTIHNLSVLDHMPNGLAFVQGSASVDTTGFNGVLPTLGVSPSGSGLAANGQDVTFTWTGETVVTGDNLPNNNSFQVAFTAVVMNVVGNQGLAGAQTLLTNSATLSMADTVATLDSTAVVVQVIEPLVSLTKRFSTSAGDAGDPVTITLTLTNSGLAAAYEVQINDPLDTRYFDSTRFATGSVPSGFSLVITGSPTPTLTIRSLPASAPATTLEPRESLQFSITSYLAQAVMPSQLISNRASVVAGDTILDTAPLGEERSIAGAQAYATLTVSNANVSKQLTATSATGPVDTTGTNLTVGETGTYRITVELPEGTVSNLLVRDLVPDGLAYVSGSVQVDTNGFAGQLPGAPAVSGGVGSGDDIAFTFSGATVVQADNVATNNRFFLTLQAQVLDVATVDGLVSAVDGDAASQLTNRVTLACLGCTGSSLTSSPVVITVQEPWPVITKSVTATTGTWFRTLITVSNRGSSTAYDLQVQDLFPTNVWNTSTLVAGTAAGFTTAWSNSTHGRWLTISSDDTSSPPDNSLEAGEVFSLSVTGSVLESFMVTAINTATVTRFTTLSGTVSGERDEPDTSATAPFGAPDLVAFLRGYDIAGLPLIGGETIHYRVTITNAGGATATAIQLRSLVPTNTTLVAGSVTNRGAQASPAGSPFTLSVGSLAAGETATITYLVTVNSGLPVAVTSIYNLATVTWNESTRTEVADNDTSGHATLVDDGLDDPLDSGEISSDDDPTILYLTTVDYGISKTLLSPLNRPAHVGEVVQFSITVTNSGGVRLATVPLVDTFDTTYLTFLKAEPASSDAINDGTLNWPSLGSINVGASASVTVYFTARTATGTTRTNLATASPTAQAPYPAPGAKSAFAPYDIDGTTFASVHSVAARPYGKSVVVEWETAAEVGTAGFRVRRAERENGTPVWITSEVVPAWNVAQGGTYQVTDPTAVVGQTYFYSIVEVEDHGGEVTYGPYPIQVEAAAPALRSVKTTPAPRPTAAFPAERSLRSSSGDSSAPLAVASVSREGLHEVTREQLASAWGWTLDEIDRGLNGDEVEIRHAGQRIPAFRSTRGISFYAPAWSNRFALADAYHLLPGRNLRLPSHRPPLSTEWTDQCMETLRVESNRTAVMTLVLDPAEDYWVWEQLIAGQANADRRSATLVLAEPGSSGQARLRIRLLGGSNTDASPDHRVVARVNGSEVGEISWEGKLPALGEWPVPLAWLRAGTNTVEIQAYKPAGVSFSVLYLDAMELDYPRRAIATRGTLALTSDGQALQVSGMDAASTLVLDVSEPFAPRRMEGVQIQGTQMLVSGTQAGHRYWLCDSNGRQAVTLIGGGHAGNLANPSNRCDYLVITTDGLAATAENLAAHRRTDGWLTRVVTLSGIYAEFGHGVAGPETVRNFLGYIHRYWKQAPRYVVLAGDGTYDYLNQLGYNDTLIPPVLVTTPNGLFASDTPYADINGDGVMEFAVGRLPARSGTELQTMISKITTYEAAGGAWTDDALLLADNADGGGAFDTESDALVRMLTNRFSTTKCYLGSQTITNARTQLLGAWQAGVAFVNYAGHGALDRMAQEGLLTSSDVTNLTNGTRLPVVVSMTCVVGRYSVPGYPCLGEELVRRATGGAIAIISPIGLSSRTLSAPLNQALINRLGHAPGRLGDLWKEASLDFIQTGGDVVGPTLYNLLGDPGLMIK